MQFQSCGFSSSLYLVFYTEVLRQESYFLLEFESDLIFIASFSLLTFLLSLEKFNVFGHILIEGYVQFAYLSSAF